MEGQPLCIDKLRKYITEQQEREQRRTLDNMITDAEKFKAQIFKPTGIDKKDERNMSTMEMNDDFFHHTVHFDNALIQKIEKGDYVDLSKLLPKE